ncbi:MAG: SBBP repeat-containing protein [Fimbriimonadaceae bacterium]|nr:SBBP repeat-containing protein [Fimbriimonadaceae bacterium]
MFFRRIGLGFLLALACAPIASAQASFTWARRYAGSFGNEDIARDCAVDSLGNVYITGSSVTGYNSSTNTYYSDAVIIKYDAAGNVLWQQTFGGNDTKVQEGVAIQVDASGSVYVAGNEDWDFLTLKYDTNGDLLWSSVFSGPGLIDTAVDLAVDPLGYVVVTGSSDQGDFLYQNYLTLRYSPTGNLLWSVRYTGSAGGNDFARAVRVDAGGNAYVTGFSEGNGTGFDVATVKYDLFGDPVWIARYGYAGAGDDGGSDLILDPAGNVYVTGASPRTANDEILLLKYNPAGIEQWVKRYVGSSGGVDSGRVLTVHPATGDIFLSGYSLKTGQGYDFLTLRYNPAGTLLWSNRYDGPAHGFDVPESITVDAATNCYVAGTSTGTTTGYDYAIVKYNPTGSQLWERRYDGGANLNDDPHGLAIDSQGSLVTAGASQQSANGPNDMATVKLVQSFLVNGSVNLGDYSGDPATLQIFVEINPVGNPNPVETGIAVLNSTGTFSFSTSRSSGNYDVYVKASHWLRKKIANVAFGANGVSGLSFSLLNGDCDGDNEIGIGDYAMLSAAYGSNLGEGNYNILTDLNGDESVDIADYAILSARYGQTGD